MRDIIKKGATAQDFYDPRENYIGYHDFALAGITERKFKIESLDVDAVPVPNSGKKENKIVATLSGTKKGLIISKGKRKALIALFGPVSNWVGKEVLIKVDPTAKYQGKVVGGLIIESNKR